LAAAFFAVAITISLIKWQRAPHRFMPVQRFTVRCLALRPCGFRVPRYGERGCDPRPPFLLSAIQGSRILISLFGWNCAGF
jgi:hypothetical protein